MKAIVWMQIVGCITLVGGGLLAEKMMRKMGVAGRCHPRDAGRQPASVFADAALSAVSSDRRSLWERLQSTWAHRLLRKRKRKRRTSRS